MSTSTSAPSAGVRALAVLGILGGAGLLLAFVAAIPPAVNTARLVLFCAGAIAIGLATFGRHAAVSRRLALAGTVPLVVANAAYIAWILLATGQERPFAGDFGLVGFWVALSFWLADAWFGVVALRLGVVWRWAALVLVAGSLLAITGMDRLGPHVGGQPDDLRAIAMTGVALNGLAWILLGVDVLLPGSAGLTTRRGRADGAAGLRSAYVARATNASAIDSSIARGTGTTHASGPTAPVATASRQRAWRLKPRSIDSIELPSGRGPARLTMCPSVRTFDAAPVAQPERDDPVRRLLARHDGSVGSPARRRRSRAGSARRS